MRDLDSDLAVEKLDSFEYPVCMVMHSDIAQLTSFVSQERFFAKERWGAEDPRPDDDLIFRPKALSAALRNQGLATRTPLAEICLLALAVGRRSLSEPLLTPVERELRSCIARRIHHLLVEHPEVLHPNIRVASAFGEVPTTVLRMLVQRDVPLDPAALRRLADSCGAAARWLQWQLDHGKRVGAPLLETAIHPDRICMASASALLALDSSPQTLDALDTEANVRRLAVTVGRLATLDSWQFQSALDLLGQLRASLDREAGKESGLRWSRDVDGMLLTADFAEEHAAVLHPVLSYITELSKASAVLPEVTPAGGDFPGPQLTEGVRALNALLLPAGRLPLERLTTEQLLKLALCCTHRSERRLMDSYWWDYESNGLRRARSPASLAHWIVEERVAPAVPAAAIDALRADLVDATMPDFAASLVAKILERTMTQHIDARTATGLTDPMPAKRPRLRSV